MGTFWNDGAYAFDLGKALYGLLSSDVLPPVLHSTVDIMDVPALLKREDEDEARSRRATVVEIPRIRLGTAQPFEEVLQAGKPVIIECINLGTCVQKWTAAYLNEKVGPEKKVGTATKKPPPSYPPFMSLELSRLGSILTNRNRLLFTKPQVPIWILTPRTSATSSKTSHHS
jgi:hypothetical protein